MPRVGLYVEVGIIVFLLFLMFFLYHNCLCVSTKKYIRVVVGMNNIVGGRSTVDISVRSVKIPENLCKKLEKISTWSGRVIVNLTEKNMFRFGFGG